MIYFSLYVAFFLICYYKELIMFGVCKTQLLVGQYGGLEITSDFYLILLIIRYRSYCQQLCVTKNSILNKIKGKRYANVYHL